MGSARLLPCSPVMTPHLLKMKGCSTGQRHKISAVPWPMYCTVLLVRQRWRKGNPLVARTPSIPIITPDLIPHLLFSPQLDLNVNNCAFYPRKVAILGFAMTKVMKVALKGKDGLVRQVFRWYPWGKRQGRTDVNVCTFPDVAIRWLSKITCGEEEAGSVTVIALPTSRCDRWLLFRWQGLVNCWAILIRQRCICCITILLGICEKNRLK